MTSHTKFLFSNTAINLLLLLVFSFIKLSQASFGLNYTTNVISPLIYTKLRHDRNFLQVYRKYQLERPDKEKKLSIITNETKSNKEIKQVSHYYYQNDQIESASVTQDDLIIEAIDRTYQTRIIPAYIYTFDNPGDRQKSSDKSKISSLKCDRELKYLVDKMTQLKESENGYVSISPELMSFFDSYAQEESGLLLGNIHWTGLWRQCEKRRIFDIGNGNVSDLYDFSGRYCIGSIRSRGWNERIRQKTKDLEGKHFKYENQNFDYDRFFRIQVGICLPESCDSMLIDTNRYNVKKLISYKLSAFFNSYDLVDIFCLPDEKSELTQIKPKGWALILFAISWTSLIGLATFYDLCYPKVRQLHLDSGNKSVALYVTLWLRLVPVFSLIQNFNRLVETESLKPRQPKQQKLDEAQVKASEPIETSFATTIPGQTSSPTSIPSLQTNKQEESSGMNLNGRSLKGSNRLSPNDLLFLNAFKSISMPFIVFGHCGMMLKHLDKYPLDYDGLNNDVMFHFNASAVFFVDWFFVISGFLTGYLTFVTKQVEKNTIGQWIHAIFHRYWRLAPMYLLSLLFSQSLFEHMGSGPNWDYGTNNMTIRGICKRESLLKPITLTSNFHPIHEECIMPAWYICNEFQFYLITPFILIILHKSPTMGWLATLSAIVACIALRIHRYLVDPRAKPLELMRPRYDLYVRNNWDMHPTYIYPHYRIASYLIGLLAGHYAFMVLSGKWNSILYYRQSRNCLANESGAKQDNNMKRFKNLLRLFAFILGLQMMLSMMFATWIISDLFPRSLEPQVKYFTAIIYGFDHSQASLGIALVLISIMFGQFPWLRRLFNLPIWTLISRLNYSVLLIQVELIYLKVQSADVLPVSSANEQLSFWIFMVATCYLVAPILVLLFEYPLAYLEREFIGKHMRVLKGGHQKQATSSNLNQINLAKGEHCDELGSDSELIKLNVNVSCTETEQETNTDSK